MKKHSDKNHYTDKTSKKRYSSLEIENKNKAAKKLARQMQIDEHGYAFCVKCMRNTNSGDIDPAHIRSELWCKKNGEIELIFDVDNIQMMCRDCHREYDKLNLKP
jgi:hypothetical protein